jgi:hypothetical protein
LPIGRCDETRRSFAIAPERFAARLRAAAPPTAPASAAPPAISGSLALAASSESLWLDPPPLLDEFLCCVGFLELLVFEGLPVPALLLDERVLLPAFLLLAAISCLLCVSLFSDSGAGLPSHRDVFVSDALAHSIWQVLALCLRLGDVIRTSIEPHPCRGNDVEAKSTHRRRNADVDIGGLPAR